LGLHFEIGAVDVNAEIRDAAGFEDGYCLEEQQDSFVDIELSKKGEAIALGREAAAELAAVESVEIARQPVLNHLEIIMAETVVPVALDQKFAWADQGITAFKDGTDEVAP
jgi:hypothetical protein